MKLGKNILVFNAVVDRGQLLLHHLLRAVLVAEIPVRVDRRREMVLVLVVKIPALVDYPPLKPRCDLSECRFPVFGRILSEVLVVTLLFLLLLLLRDNAEEINSRSVQEVMVLEVMLGRILGHLQKVQ